MTGKLLIAESNGNANNGVYTSKASIRKAFRKMKNGPGRNHSIGGRVENSKGFPPNYFDRILLDAPCSALGLRPRLFSGQVRQNNQLPRLFSFSYQYIPLNI